MDENRSLEQQAEEMLRQKLDEFDSLDIESEGAKNAAETLAKVADVHCKLQQEKRSKKEWILKGLGILAGAAGVVGAAFVKALFDVKINERQLEYLDYEHTRAYDFEENGNTEHIVTSPAAKDALRERPKKF